MGHKRTSPKPQRLNLARQWLPTFNGTKIVKGYKKKFAVDTLTAISDLQELGVELDPGYVARVKISEGHRCANLEQKKQEKQEKLMEHHGLELMYEEMGIWDNVYGGEYIDDIHIPTNHRVNFENKIGTVKKAGKNLCQSEQHAVANQQEMVTVKTKTAGLDL